MPAFLIAALQAAPLLIQAGTGLEEFGAWLYGVITKKGDPTPEDWAELHAREDAARAILNDTLRDVRPATGAPTQLSGS